MRSLSVLAAQESSVKAQAYAARWRINQLCSISLAARNRQDRAIRKQGRHDGENLQRTLTRQSSFQSGHPVTASRLSTKSDADGDSRAWTVPSEPIGARSRTPPSLVPRNQAARSCELRLAGAHYLRKTPYVFLNT